MAIRILIVDDEPDVAWIHAETLRAAHPAFSVETVGMAHAAVERAASRSVDCIVLDHCLPDQNGMECLTRIRERAPDLPVVIVTGYGDEALAVEALKQRGATDYVARRKNYLPHLLQCVHDALTRAVFRQEGGGFRIGFGGVNAWFPSRVGLIYLRELIFHAGTALAVETLASHRVVVPTEPLRLGEIAADGLRIVQPLSRGERELDARARRDFLRRRSELLERRRSAVACDDLVGAERCDDELEALMKALRSDRRSARSTAKRESLRIAVRYAVQRALAGIACALPSLHRHLEPRVRLGTHCTYTPDPQWPLYWTF